jgi:hypothetical protein
MNKQKIRIFLDTEYNSKIIKRPRHDSILEMYDYCMNKMSKIIFK